MNLMSVKRLIALLRTPKKPRQRGDCMQLPPPAVSGGAPAPLDVEGAQ